MRLERPLAGGCGVGPASGRSGDFGRAAAAAPGAARAGYADETQFNISQSGVLPFRLSAAGAIGGAAIGRGIGMALWVFRRPDRCVRGRAAGGTLGSAAASFCPNSGRCGRSRWPAGKGGQASDLLPYATFCGARTWQ